MRTLKDELTPEDWVTEVRLSLNTSGGKALAWVVVEGEDDLKIYSKFFKRENTRMILAGDCLRLQKVVGNCCLFTDRVIGIKDADCDRLNNTSVMPNVFLTDGHDIEMTMVKDDRVLENICSEYNMAKERILKIRLSILRLVMYIGYVRWYNDVNQLCINFKDFAHGRFFKRSPAGKYSYRCLESLDELNKRSSNKIKVLLKQDISAFIRLHKGCDSYQLCNGHDMADVFALALSSELPRAISHITFSTHLRLSFNIYHFKDTTLYKDLAAWADNRQIEIWNNEGV